MSIEYLTDWLNQRFSPLLPWPRYVLLSAGVLLLILIVVALLLRRRKKYRVQRSLTPTQEIETKIGEVEEKPCAPVEISNLQGLGQREEQQDAFALSNLTEYAHEGLLLILCDGMGGLHDGAEIAMNLVQRIRQTFPLADFAACLKETADSGAMCQAWAETLAQYSKEIFTKFRGQGGATLIQIYLYSGQLLFWSVGDSDLFLYRKQRLYAMNQHHEYLNDLYLAAALSGTAPILAHADPQKSALSHFMGQEHIACDFSYKPFPLVSGDRLLLCSDGISDTLSQTILSQCMALESSSVLLEMESRLKAAALANQDNYTAILLRYKAAVEAVVELIVKADSIKMGLLGREE